MSKLIQCTELAILIAALYFTHIKLLNFQYVEAACVIISILIYRGISIYKSRELKKIDAANRNIIADLEKRLSYELRRIALQESDVQQLTTEDFEVTVSEPELIKIAHVPIITDNELMQLHARAVSSKDIADVARVNPSTISRRLKKLKL